VSFSDGKIVVGNLSSFDESNAAKDGASSQDKNQVTFTINESTDMQDGYTPKAGDAIKFRYEADGNGGFKMVFVRYIGTPENNQNSGSESTPDSAQEQPVVAENAD
ncbi:MAG: hypothetical protein KBS83_05710, partial [Lachnospiraceae bacterium]|nr:hypothetical protein [Candidatus Equihabitans merdae]